MVTEYTLRITKLPFSASVHQWAAQGRCHSYLSFLTSQLFTLNRAGYLFYILFCFAAVLSLEVQAQSPSVALSKQVNKSIANKGDQLTYTLIVANTGSTSVTNVVVRDSSSSGLRYVTDSATPPTGTTFTHNSAVSLWTVATLSAGQSLTLTFQAVADSSGILYNRATIPGDTAIACTSVPIHVCTGDQYTFRLTVPAGRSSYRWFKDNVELSNQTTNTLDVTTPGSYSLAIDNVSGRCPDFSCCSFIVIEDGLPSYQARTVSADCARLPQPSGKIVLSDFTPTHTYQYSAGTTFNAAASLSGVPKVIPANGVIADNLANPPGDAAYTIRVYNGADCYIDQTVTLLPAACCSLSVTASAGPCAPATNTYSSTVLVSLTNPGAGVLTVTDGPASMTFATTATSSASFTAVFTDLISDRATHNVTVSLPGCSTASTTYTAPASCSACVNPVISIANNAQTICTGTTPLPFSASVVSGTATAYAWYGPLSSTTAALGTAISGQTSATYQPDGNQSPGTYYYALLTVGNPSSCTSVTFASLTINPRPSLAQVPVSACAGQPVDILTSFSVVNGPATVAVYASQADRVNRVSALTNTVVSLSATTTFYISLTTATGCTGQGETTLTVNPRPNAGTNQTLACGNGATPTSTTLTATGVASGTWSARPGNPASVSFSNGNDLSTRVSGLTVPGSYTFVFTSPASCSSSVTVEVPSCPCALTLEANPGACDVATNRYGLSGTVRLTNTPASSLTLTDGQSSAIVSVSAGQSSAAFSLSGLTSGTGSHTITVVSSATICRVASLTYSAPASCTVSPTLALSAIPGDCQTATNQYVLSGSLSLTNAIASTATITDGSATTTITVNAGATSVAYSLSGLASGTGSHTVTVSYAGQTAITTYTAPGSCTVAPVCSVSATATAGVCSTATNTYSSTVLVTLTNPSAGVLTVTDGVLSLTTAISATLGNLTYPAVFTGIASDGSSHAVTASLSGCSSVSTTYTAPVSCTLGLNLSVTDPGVCQPATNSYTTTGVISLTNAVAGTALITDGTFSTVVSVTAGQASATYSLTGLPSGSGKHTVTVAYAGKTASTTYTAPVSCTVAPCGMAMIVTPSLCQSATNTYTLSGTLTAANVPVNGTLTVSSTSLATQTLSLTSGNSSNTFSYSGLVSNGQTYTLTASYSDSACSPVSQTFTAPASCSVAPICSVSATAKAVPVTCTGNVQQANGQLVLSNFKAGYSYQYALGNTFNGNASLSGAPQPIPAGGTLVQNLPNPAVAQPYTIRVYDSPTCYSDITVLLAPTACTCPPSKCVPFVIRRIK
jgi:uncharacterized repeat protein (TIGR01451 family)